MQPPDHLSIYDFPALEQFGALGRARRYRDGG